jgi:hypothetical protein
MKDDLFKLKGIKGIQVERLLLKKMGFYLAPMEAVSFFLLL